MKKLYKGIQQFQESYFKKEEDFFKRLSSGQSPQAFFITCVDSRVDPNLITQSKPGELFILRNVGNLIPSYDAIKDKNSVAAAIEFAVLKLKVKDIIVCGHSNCGAMQALYKDEKEFEDTPHLLEWLKLALPVKDEVKALYPDDQSDIPPRIIEEKNIIVQLKNIQTYPFVSKALEEGLLYLHGWYYEIHTGKVYVYNPTLNSFEDIIFSEDAL